MKTAVQFLTSPHVIEIAMALGWEPISPYTETGAVQGAFFSPAMNGFLGQFFDVVRVGIEHCE